MSAFSRTAALKPERTVRLVPHIPFIISWLRHKEARAADLLLGNAKNVDDDEVQTIWSELLEAFDTYGDLTTLQLRAICADHEPAVLARSIHVLFMGVKPRIVPKKVSTGLFAAAGKIRNVDNGPEIAKLFSAELDKMKLVCLEALGELCALIRDTAGDPKYAATTLGPSIFLDQDYKESELIIASRTMQMLVDHAEYVFGKSGTRSKFDPLGVRPRNYDDNKPADTESSISGRSREKKPVETKKMASALSDAGFM